MTPVGGLATVDDVVEEPIGRRVVVDRLAEPLGPVEEVVVEAARVVVVRRGAHEPDLEELTNPGRIDRGGDGVRRRTVVKARRVEGVERQLGERPFEDWALMNAWVVVEASPLKTCGFFRWSKKVQVSPTSAAPMVCSLNTLASMRRPEAVAVVVVAVHVEVLRALGRAAVAGADGRETGAAVQGTPVK